jgi:beta-galactosidase
LLYKIEGAGEIAGVDNANLKDIDPYVATTRKAWHGRALVVIRSKQIAGDIKLTVSSPGLTESTLTLKAVINK